MISAVDPVETQKRRPGDDDLFTETMVEKKENIHLTDPGSSIIVLPIPIPRVRYLAGILRKKE